MEFYLVDDLECDLIVFHPYRTLMTLCGKENGSVTAEHEAGELGSGIQDGPRYWGTGEGKLELQEPALQLAWLVSATSYSLLMLITFANRHIVNDAYRSDLCLIYPPHLIAIAAIYLTLVFHEPTSTSIQAQSSHSSGHHPQSQPHSTQSTPGNPRRSSRSRDSASKKATQDIVGFMAGLNVNMEVVASIAQEIISLYTLWDQYKEDGTDGSGRSTFSSDHSMSLRGTKRSTAGARSGSTTNGDTTGSRGGTPDEVPSVVTPQYLTRLVVRMREARLADIAHPANARPMPLNKRLERTQNA